MALNDEIGNFSKRREVSNKNNETSYNEDEYEYDDWDEEDDYDDGNSTLNFKMYNLGELEKYNVEAKELEELISPWWKNIKVIFSKEVSQKIGVMDYKKKNLLKDDLFEDVQIQNVDNSLKELNIFAGDLRKSYKDHFIANIYGLLFLVPFIYWNGWSLIWYLLVAWSLLDMAVRHYKYMKQNEWLVKAETFICAQEGKESTIEEDEEEEEDTLATIMKFNETIRKDESEHWSIKIYDAVANLFKRKK